MLATNARILVILTTLSILISSCSDENSTVSTQPLPGVASTIQINGGGVKGPLANGIVTAYAVDTTMADLKGAELGVGTTGDNARISDLDITPPGSGLVLLEVTAGANTTDISSGVAPLLSSLVTIVNLDAIAAQDYELYASPLTSVAVELARLNADSNLAPYAGNSDGTISEQELIAALGQAAAQVVSSLGFGMAASADIFSQRPILTGATGDDDSQRQVLAYRQAIEAMSAIIALAVADAEASNPATVATPDSVLKALGMDLADGRIDGLVGTTAIMAFADVSNIGNILLTDVSQLRVPGTDVLVSDVAQFVVSERTITGYEVDVTNIQSGTVSAGLAPARVIADIDGDQVIDQLDAFPRDASESVDTDGDGTGNNADLDDDNDGVPDLEDAFALDATETLDTDNDGLGNNADGDDDNDGVPDMDDNLPLDPRGAVASETTIGPEGGIVRSSDGRMTLTFPAGALATSTNITIGTPTAAATAEFSDESLPVEGHYLLGPDGLQFAEPVLMDWQISSESQQPNAIRMVYTVSEGVAEAPEGPTMTNPDTGVVSASIRHFSDLFVVSTQGVLGINQPSARVGDTLTWNYDFQIQENNFAGHFRTEGAVRLDDQGNVGITRQPELLMGEEVISSPKHERPVECFFSYDQGDEELSFECNPSTSGTIEATCLAGTEAGLRSRIGFNLEFELSSDFFRFFPLGRALLRVEADGICRTSTEITEPVFISIGNDIDRITEAPEGLVIEECDGQSQPYHVVASNTQMRIINASGSCSRSLNYSANDNAIFGALLLQLDLVQQLFIYGQSGVFITQLIDGVFGELSDFTSATTDAQWLVNDDGSVNSSQAHTVTNAGRVKLRTLNADGSNSLETVFSTFGTIGEVLIGFTAVTSKTGYGITSANPSRVFHINLESNTATELGEVGETALGISCERLSCETSQSCSVENDETVGCAVTAFDSEQLYRFYATDVLTNSITPTVNFTQPIPGIKTASPYTRSNAAGQLVTATVNYNEVGKVFLSIEDADGNESQTAEFFLTQFTEATGFTGLGSSIVMIAPSPEYPNGAVRIGVDNPNGTDDGILTIPVSEELLGTSPVPFFGDTFVGE